LGICQGVFQTFFRFFRSGLNLSTIKIIPRPAPNVNRKNENFQKNFTLGL
jgi:hypothetical protein